jgi:branched-chain amino acid transport system ATP-binding protein
MKDPALSVNNVSLRFGGVAALSNVSFDLDTGHILGLIGPNGAGKTSLINVITGSYRANEGSVRLNGQELLHLPQHRRAALGLVRTFQNLALFRGMTVFENVMVGRHLHIRDSILSNFLPSPASFRSRDEVASAGIVDDLLELLGLADVQDAEVSSLPYGFQKRVELARALAAEPTLLLLDEPFAGMTPVESRELARVILDVWKQRGLTILMIEHNMGLIMDIADRVVVLDFGRVVAVGVPDDIKTNHEVIRAYVGGEITASDQAAP